MSKVKQFVGIDISKLTFDVGIPTEHEGKYKHEKFNNNEAGFKQFEHYLGPDSVCVMEASGPYYVQLASYFYELGVDVRVANPLAVKHFAKMRMARAKTDKKDAALIAEYAKSQNPPRWRPKVEHLLQLQQLQAVVEGFVVRRTQVINQQEAFTAVGLAKSPALNILKKELKHIDDAIKTIEDQMEAITEKHHGEMFAQLKSIPGIGKRTAMLLIVITDGFKRFHTAKELVGYIGLCPRIYDSGTSVKGKQRICKMGMSNMRALLYMCAMQAKRRNAACLEMFTRLKAKGKNGKLVIVAIANKLVKQAFAIATQGKYYEAKLIA